MHTNQRLKYSANASKRKQEFQRENKDTNTNQAGTNNGNQSFIDLTAQLTKKLKYTKEIYRIITPRRKTTQACTKNAYIGVEMLRGIKNRKDILEHDPKSWLIIKRKLGVEMSIKESELYKTISTIRSDMFDMGAGFWFASNGIKKTLDKIDGEESVDGEGGFLTYYKPDSNDGDDVVTSVKRRRGRGTSTIVARTYDADTDVTRFKLIKKDDARDIILGSSKRPSDGKNTRKTRDNTKKTKSSNNYETKVEWKDQRNPNSGTFYTDNVKELIKKNAVISPEYQNIENFNAMTEIGSQEIKVVQTKKILDFIQFVWTEHTQHHKSKNNTFDNDKEVDSTQHLKTRLEAFMSANSSSSATKNNQGKKKKKVGDVGSTYSSSDDSFNPTASVVPNGPLRPLLFFPEDTRTHTGIPVKQMPGVMIDYTKMQLDAQLKIQNVIKKREQEKDNSRNKDNSNVARYSEDEDDVMEDIDDDDDDEYGDDDQLEGEDEDGEDENDDRASLSANKGSRSKPTATKKRDKILQEKEKRARETRMLQNSGAELVSKGRNKDKVDAEIAKVLSIREKLASAAAVEKSPNDKNHYFTSATSIDKVAWNMVRKLEEGPEEASKRLDVYGNPIASTTTTNSSRKGRKQAPKKVNKQLEALAANTGISIGAYNDKLKREARDKEYDAEDALIADSVKSLFDNNPKTEINSNSTSSDVVMDENQIYEGITNTSFSAELLDNSVKRMEGLTAIKTGMEEFFKDDCLLKQTYLSDEAKNKLRAYDIDDHEFDNPAHYSGEEWKHKKTPQEVEAERKRQLDVAAKASIVFNILMADKEAQDSNSSFKNRFNVQKAPKKLEGNTGYDVVELEKSYIAEFLKEPKSGDRLCRNNGTCMIVQLAIKKRGIINPQDLAKEFSSATPIAETKTIKSDEIYKEEPTEYRQEDYGAMYDADLNYNNNNNNGGNVHIKSEPVRNIEDFNGYYDYQCPTSPGDVKQEPNNTNVYYSGNQVPDSAPSSQTPASSSSSSSSFASLNRAKVGFGFVGKEFLLPDQLDHYNATGERPEQVGMCVVCEIARVNNEYHRILREFTMPKVNDGMAYVALNKFCVKVGPGQYNTNCMLKSIPSSNYAIIYGHFPAFVQTNYVFAMGRDGQQLVEIGMDFPQSSVVSTRVSGNRN